MKSRGFVIRHVLTFSAARREVRYLSATGWELALDRARLFSSAVRAKEVRRELLQTAPVKRENVSVLSYEAAAGHAVSG